MATNIISGRRQESKRDSARQPVTPRELNLMVEVLDELRRTELKGRERVAFVAKAFNVPLRRLQGSLAAA